MESLSSAGSIVANVLLHRSSAKNGGEFFWGARDNRTGGLDLGMAPIQLNLGERGQNLMSAPPKK